MKKISSLKDFYPFYLTEHADKTNRTLHFVGTSLVIISFLLILIFKLWYYLFILPVLGYSFAWLGHMFFEKNKPATFKYPLYSLVSDFIMWWHILTFQIDDKIKSARQLY